MGRERIGGGQSGAAPVSDPHATPGEIQLADHTGWYWTQQPVEDEERGSCHG